MRDLTVFCAMEATRYSLETPFVIDGYEYFSDGRICIKRKTDKPETTDKTPDCEACFKQSREISLTTPIPILDPSYSDEKCTFCLGTGKEHVICNMCDGFGCHDCDCGTDHECGYCDATGRIECYNDKFCLYCDGKRLGFRDVRIEDVLFKGYYIGLIFRMFDNPKVVSLAISCKKVHDEPQGTGSMRFTFNGGEGLLMSISEN